MKVNVRFFARFGELLGKNVMTEVAQGTSLAELVRGVTKANMEGYNAIFDENENFRGFVILTVQGKRVKAKDAETTVVSEGDEIAVFPPVAGG